jgi:DNA polymerase-3 subunit gamma/tau
VAEPTGADFVSLYRRFRPSRFTELRGQPHVVRALQGAVRDGRVAHAYLFSGPRGTGKTSTARILARALNCAAPADGEPCGVCRSCVEIARGSSFDVHELDAASNNGVDAMRELIAHAALATPGQWKVYIVDEVHMLSNAAANALLKTLEEPPGHVVFVLATTDPQKVPATIRSRTQHLEFGLIGADTLEGLLHDVSVEAGLGLTDDDIAVAVRKGRGSARDALSALDQVVASGSAEALRPDVVGLTEAISGDDARQALVAVAALHESGWGSQQIATELVDELRQAFLVVLAPELCGAAGRERERLSDQAGRLGLARVVRAIERLGHAQVDMRDAPDPRAVLEVTLVRLARPELDDSTAALLDRVARLEQIAAGGALSAGRAGAHPGSSVLREPPAPTSPPQTEPPEPALEERPGLGAFRRHRGAGRTEHAQDADLVPASTSSGHSSSSDPGGGVDVDSQPVPDRDRIVEAWGDHILRGLPARAKALFSAGRFVSVEDGTATFALPNASHRERCEEVRGSVEEAIGAYFGTPVSLVLTVDELPATAPPASRAVRAPASATPASATPASATPASATPASATPASVATRRATPATVGGLHPDDEVDPDQPSGSLESVAQARLLEAFPGAQEV